MKRLTIAAGLLAAAFVSTAAITYSEPPAIRSVAGNEVADAAEPLTIGPFAFGATTSEASHRVFVLSSYMDNRNGGITGAGRLSILDSRTGKLLRQVAVGRGAHDVAVDDRTGHVFVAEAGDMVWYRQGNLNLYKRGNAGLTMVDTRTGRVLRHIRWGEQSPGPLVLSTSTSRLFVGTARASGKPAPTFHMIDTRTGAQMQARPGSEPRDPTVVLGSVQRVFTTASGGVQVRDARNWTLLKTLPIKATAMVPDDSRSRVVALTHGGRSLVALDGRTGRALHSMTLPGNRVGWHIMADERTGHAFVIGKPAFTGMGSARGGWILSVDVGAGRVLRTVTVGSTTGDAVVDGSVGHVMALSSWSTPSGTVSKLTVIDTRTGARVRDVPQLASYPFTGLTVDTKTARAFARGVRGVVARPQLADIVKAANSVTVFDSRTGSWLRAIDLSSGRDAL